MDRSALRARARALLSGIPNVPVKHEDIQAVLHELALTQDERAHFISQSRLFPDVREDETMRVLRQLKGEAAKVVPITYYRCPENWKQVPRVSGEQMRDTGFVWQTEAGYCLPPFAAEAGEEEEKASERESESEEGSEEESEEGSEISGGSVSVMTPERQRQQAVRNLAELLKHRPSHAHLSGAQRHSAAQRVYAETDARCSAFNGAASACKSHSACQYQSGKCKASNNAAHVLAGGGAGSSSVENKQIADWWRRYYAAAKAQQA